MRSRKFQFLALAISLGLLFGFSTATLAQSDREAVAAVYQASASIATNIRGISTFNEAPKGFDALKASDTELATYGFPPRPSPQTDPDRYAQWARAMRAAKIRWNGQLRDMGAYSTGAKIVKTVEPATSAVPSTGLSFNWSGIVNTNKLTTWNKNSSVYYVISSFNIPVAQTSFGTCDGGYDWEVSWNGIDGWNTGDVLQGGSSSQVYCNSPTYFTNYCGWVEWYPSYPILCEFNVNPGDDFYVESYSPSGGFSNGLVFIEDETTLTYGTYSLSYVTGPPLVGNSAEYIVERPCCRGNNLYPLANYVENFWANSLGVDFYHYDHGLATQYYPGNTSPTTWVVSMVDDGDTQVISVPAAQGKTGVFFYDTGCAYTGGCTP
jgi:Peptidase A4 family